MKIGLALQLEEVVGSH